MSQIDEIQKMLDDTRHEGYLNGIADGLRVAERIYVYYAANHKLKEPETLEILKEWAEKDLNVLREKLEKG